MAIKIKYTQTQKKYFVTCDDFDFNGVTTYNYFDRQPFDSAQDVDEWLKSDVGRQMTNISIDVEIRYVVSKEHT